VTLDDGRDSQNPDPAIHPNGAIFDLGNRFRGGDTAQDVTGVLDFAFGLYRVQPTRGADYAVTNPRPAQPDDVGGNLTVASFNVLNYFTTLDRRGANTAEEFERQRTKVIAAITELDADVVGLIEIENNEDAIEDLVNGLNAASGAGTYSYIATGVVGTDEIKVAFVYRSADRDSARGLRHPRLVGRPALPRHQEPARPRPELPDERKRRRLHRRRQPPQVQGLGLQRRARSRHRRRLGQLQPHADGGRKALVDWLAGDPTGSGDDDFLIIGDLNSYDKEDPIDALLAGGYTDLVRRFEGEFAYSFVFDGQLGYLDYALAGGGLVDEVTGTTEWHINADEPDILDYDTTFKQPAQDALFEPNAFRSSDHDAVLVGLDSCDEIAPTLEVSVTPGRLWPPNHRYMRVEATAVADDIFDPTPVVDLVSVVSNEPDNGPGDGNTTGDVVIVDQDTFRLRAERAGGGSGRIYTITYRATDAATRRRRARR
jgi:hypothetical protein